METSITQTNNLIAVFFMQIVLFKYMLDFYTRVQHQWLHWIKVPRILRENSGRNIRCSLVTRKCDARSIVSDICWYITLLQPAIYDNFLELNVAPYVLSCYTFGNTFQLQLDKISPHEADCTQPLSQIPLYLFKLIL